MDGCTLLSLDRTVAGVTGGYIVLKLPTPPALFTLSSKLNSPGVGENFNGTLFVISGATTPVEEQTSDAVSAPYFAHT